MANIPGALEIGGLIRSIEIRVYEALDEAVDYTVSMGEQHAKRLAPVRKVSQIERRAKVRQLTRAEILKLPASASGGARSKGGQFTGSFAPRFTTVRRAEQMLPTPEVRETEAGYRLKNEGDESFLSWRGRAEMAEKGRHEGTYKPNLATGEMVKKPGTSAIHTSSPFTPGVSKKATSKSTIGGRLRAEIRAEMGAVVGGKVTGWILSPTEYARYVELPTSRTAAQPYMRPTLKFLKRPFVAAVRRELKRRGFRVTG